MLIQPDTNIYVLKDCPLDKTYEHTLYFDSLSAQAGYFKGLRKHTLTKQSYQRYDKGVLHIQIPAESLYDCNYLMFQNAAFGTKWFYAFITSVEYINNVSSKVHYELDVMQTWFFDYTLGECFVEREHSDSDELYGNLVKENLDLGDEYVCNKTDIFDMNDMSVCMLCALDPLTGEETSEYGRVLNGVFTPLLAQGYRVADKGLNDALVDIYVKKEGKEDAIVAIYQYPSFLGSKAHEVTDATKVSKRVPPVGTINGYTPRNKKLFSHPYNFLLVSNNAGQTAEYKWENWAGENDKGSFTIGGVIAPQASVICYPNGYRGITNDYDSGIVLNSFPQCPWVGDAFKAWLAQNRASTAASLATTAISTIGAFVVNPTLGGASLMNLGSKVASTIAKVSDLKNTPPQVHGQTQTETLNAGIGKVQFNFYLMSIKAQFARIIDDYFDRFGYATHKNKVPNRSVRPHWTYTKTIGCTVTGSLPADDLSSIIKIYDNGITFWKNGSEVGNYSLDNRPT